MNTTPTSINPTREHVSDTPDHGGGHWPAQVKSKRPIHAPPVPQTFVSVPATSTRWAGSQPGFLTAPPELPVAEHMNGNNVLLERVGMTQYPQQQQYGWVQHPHDLIAGITPPATPPGQAGLIMYDAFGMSRGGLPAQTQGHVRVHVHAHAQGLLQGQRWPCLYVHPNQGHTTKPVYLSHPQQSEKDFLAQYYARLSLADTGAVADKKSPIIPATTAPSSTVTVTTTPEAPTAQQQSQIVTETTTGTGTGTGTGATGLTITTVTGTSTSTRTITGSDGTVLVPPPIPAHPGCELSPQMAKVMEDYAIEHCCDYMQAKNLLRDKIVAKVLENTQEKLMELLQNELDRMSSEEEEEEEDDDDDLDLDDSDMEEEGDWTTLEG